MEKRCPWAWCSELPCDIPCFPSGQGVEQDLCQSSAACCSADQCCGSHSAEQILPEAVFGVVLSWWRFPELGSKVPVLGTGSVPGEHCTSP